MASDVAALLPVTRRFMFLEEGDVAEIRRKSITIVDPAGNPVTRPVLESELPADAVERGQYRHFMLKEIHEQPRAIAQTLEERVSGARLLEAAFGPDRGGRLQAGARPCTSPPAARAITPDSWPPISWSRFAASPPAWRSRANTATAIPVVLPDTLFVTLSQSGETADTLAALRNAKRADYLSTLTICNVAESSMVRDSELVLLTRAGPEIGVASTKAFTTQLTALGMLVVALAKNRANGAELERELMLQLLQLPGLVEKTLALDDQIRALAEVFAEKHHALFLGRGPLHAIAMEGALKLKEISYIHAEAYAAAELKHGPLALVDEHMPVITVAPNNELLEKLKSNLHEVRARGGQLYVFADPQAHMQSAEGVNVIQMPAPASLLQAPVVFAVPMQLLAYHVAVLKGTDVDQPRNLAKSVTVE